LEGHWIKGVREAWSTAKAGVEKLNKKAASIEVFNNLQMLGSTDDLQKKIQTHTTAFSIRFRIVSATTRPLSEFIKWAIYREVTFEDAGKGFQDAVIYCTVLDDMKFKKLNEAVLVTGDKAFQFESATQLAKGLGVKLNIVNSIDDLETMLKTYLNSIIRAYLDKESQQLREALDACKQNIQEFLVENLTFSSYELGLFRTVKKVESLEVTSIENVHSTFGLTDAVKENGKQKIKVSADVKIRLVLDVEPLSASEPERLKIGGGKVPASEIARPSLGAIFLAVQDKIREVIVVVEADAMKAEAGYSDFQFTGARLKPSDSAFASLGNILGGTK
jgi:hypothetical protein